MKCYWAFEEERWASHRVESDGHERTGRSEGGRPKRIWLDRVSVDLYTFKKVT